MQRLAFKGWGIKSGGVYTRWDKVIGYNRYWKIQVGVHNYIVAGNINLLLYDIVALGQAYLMMIELFKYKGYMHKSDD